MDVNFKPYKTGMVTVKEKYPCGRGDSKGRNHVYYLCQCDCGKEFIVSGDELSRHPYSCGCTPKPIKGKGRLNDWALGYDGKEHTMLCMRAWRNGRRAGLRNRWATVQVQVLLPAPI